MVLTDKIKQGIAMTGLGSVLIITPLIATQPFMSKEPADKSYTSIDYGYITKKPGSEIHKLVSGYAQIACMPYKDVLKAADKTSDKIVTKQELAELYQELFK